MINPPFAYAGFWARITAFALDYLLIAGYLLLVILLSSAANTRWPNLAGQIFTNPLTSQSISFCLVTLPVALYFALLEASPWQATWGKRRKGLAVIEADGRRLSRRHSIGRTALKLIPWELSHTCLWQLRFAQAEPSPLITAGFVLVWMLVGLNVVSLLLSRTQQTLYDRLARTWVVTG